MDLQYQCCDQVLHTTTATICSSQQILLIFPVNMTKEVGARPARRSCCSYQAGDRIPFTNTSRPHSGNVWLRHCRIYTCDLDYWPHVTLTFDPVTFTHFSAVPTPLMNITMFNWNFSTKYRTRDISSREIHVNGRTTGPDGWTAHLKTYCLRPLWRRQNWGLDF